jgi:hypothetical protein
MIRTSGFSIKVAISTICINWPEISILKDMFCLHSDVGKKIQMDMNYPAAN